MLLSILVSSLPTMYDNNFEGARALPSVSGYGAYVQYKKYFYELQCIHTCNWTVMDQQLTTPVRHAVMMYLP